MRHAYAIYIPHGYFMKLASIFKYEQIQLSFFNEKNIVAFVGSYNKNT